MLLTYELVANRTAECCCHTVSNGKSFSYVKHTQFTSTLIWHSCRLPWIQLEARSGDVAAQYPRSSCCRSLSTFVRTEIVAILPDAPHFRPVQSVQASGWNSKQMPKVTR